MGQMWAIMIAMYIIPAKEWLQMCLKSSYKQLSAMYYLLKSVISRYYPYAAFTHSSPPKLLLKIDFAPLSSLGFNNSVGIM